MKRTILSLIFSAVLASASAQDMQTLFCQMPDQYIPQLQDAWRKDLTDLFKEGKEARLKNNMNGYSTLEALNDDYLRLQSTERTRIEMRRFPLINGTYVICMVTTYFGPAPDSRVAFYSTDWKPLDGAAIFTPPAPADFFRHDADTTSVAWQDTQAALDMDLMEYRLSPDAPTLTVAYATPEYLSKEMQKTVSPFLTGETIVYDWKQSRFERATLPPSSSKSF